MGTTVYDREISGTESVYLKLGVLIQVGIKSLSNEDGNVNENVAK